MATLPAFSESIAYSGYSPTPEEATGIGIAWRRLWRDHSVSSLVYDRILF